MALLKKKIILLNKTKTQQNPQHIELVNLVEQSNNHLEQIIKTCIDKNTSLPDIIKEKSPTDEVLQSQIYDIYFRLVKEKMKENTILNQWYVREYQKHIIENIIIKLFSLNKLYLELATGGGKSYIIYKIMSNIRPDTIIIFSPRKKINKQNISKKYLSLINNDYSVYNCSDDNNFNEFKKKCIRENKKIIIVACPQSSNDKVYDIINDYKLSNIFIWYDEAHHTIENWVNKFDNKTIKFFLEDKTKITNRIYTSASPDKEHINKYLNIFGELYSPIKVKELIKLKWLCPIKCKILQYDIKVFNLVKWILDGFTEDSKNFGFSFHSRDNNAFNLFYKHYDLFINSKTNIKPYLLINDSGLNEINKTKLKDIKLRYDFRDYKDFENTQKSMAYVVKQYDMGYDFKDLDYIVFTDPKVSFKDIIQCIGRGVRPDVKGENGRNLNKELLLKLPVYINEEDTNDYKNIIEVLRYLILDLNIDIEKILINPIKLTDSEELSNEEYKGDKINNSILLDLLYSHNILEKVNTKSLIKFCKTYKINNEQDYYRFKEHNPSLNLKNNLYEYPGFYWKNIIDTNNELYYNTKLECKKAKSILIKDFQKKLNEKQYNAFLENIEDKGWFELNKYDKKIPPYHDLDKYYPE
jgi:hypothetical protein